MIESFRNTQPPARICGAGKIHKRRVPPPNWQFSARRGVSLVEMLVVITIAAVMVGLAATTMHLLLAAEHEATRSMRFSASVTRLSRAFRDDLHAARDVELPLPEPGKPATLVAAADDGRRIRYELDANRATRVELDGADETQREMFYFPPRSRLGFERAGEKGLVRLTIEMPVGVPRTGQPPVASSTEPVQRLAIEAAPARIRRHATPEDQENEKPVDESEIAT
jgi:prepilin-type N-terminal cleavage/methylation domain-containing protein